MNETFAQRVKRLRDDQGFTASALASAAQTSEGTIRNIEGGHTKTTSLHVGMRLADVLHVDPRYLAFGEGSSLRDRIDEHDRRLRAMETRVGTLERRR